MIPVHTETFSYIKNHTDWPDRVACSHDQQNMLGCQGMIQLLHWSMILTCSFRHCKDGLQLLRSADRVSGALSLMRKEEILRRLACQRRDFVSSYGEKLDSVSEHIYISVVTV